jgi:hypothetical protein
VGATGLVITRADSAFYTRDVIAAIRRGGARFSVTARHNPAVVRAIAGIDPTAWSPIHHPNAVFDEDEQRWISDAEVAEVPFTAFTSRRSGEQITARLIVRRVRRLNPVSAQGHEQDELFAAYRYHGVFTDSPLQMLAAEADHRGHAIIEQVIADLKDSALAHLPSGKFTANAAWLVLAAIAFNLTRAAGALASAVHARARTATIRTQLIGVPARLARSARRVVPAPTPRLALAACLAGATRGSSPTTRHRVLTTSPTGPDRNRPWKSRTDRQHEHAHQPEQDHKP